MKHIAVAALILYLLLPAASATGATPDVIPLRAGEDVKEVARLVSYFLDTEGTLSLTGAIGKSDQFVRNTGSLVNAGTSKSVVWIRLRMSNMSGKDGSWILSLNKKLVDIAEVHFITGERVSLLLANSQKARRQSFEEFGVLAARFALDPHAKGDIYIRFRGSTWSGLLLTLQTERSFHESKRFNLVFFLVLLGGMATIILFGCMPFVFMGNGIFLLYGLAQSALFVLYAHFEGITTVYLWPDNPEYGRLLSPLAFGIFVVSMAQFARVFFETARRARFANIVLGACVVFGGAAILMLPLVHVFPAFDRRLPALLLYAVALVVWLFLPILAAYATRYWQREAWPLVIAWGLMGLFSIWLLLIWSGVVTEMPLGTHSYGVMAYLEALFIYIALALRVRAVRNEALQAQQQLSASLDAQLEESRHSIRLAGEREAALQDLAEKGRLLLSAGHDTRQMLSALRNYAAGLRLSPGKSDVERVGREIDLVTDNLTAVLTTVIDGSRSGGIADSALALDTVSVSSIMEPLRLIHGRAALDKDLELKLRASEAMIVTDRVLIIRILSNLISNAIKYTDAGKVLVACRPFHDGHRFQVMDTGKGIEPTALETLLDPQAGDLRLDHHVGGLGAGLGIAKTLASRLGGKVSARSTPGAGSVFELLLPNIRAGFGVPTAITGRPSIALFDGDATEIEHLSRAARSLGFDLLAASTPQEATSLLNGKGANTKLTFIDQHFGGTDGGIALAKRLEPHGRCAVLTYDRSIEARTKISESCGLVVYKPVSAAAFQVALSVLRRRNPPEN